jgi:hypothetical protein
VAFKLERTLKDKVDTKVEDKVGVNAHYEAVMLKASYGVSMAVGQ